MLIATALGERGARLLVRNSDQRSAPWRDGESTALMAAAGGEYLTSSCLYFVDISLSHTHTPISVFPAAADARHDPIGR